MEAHSLCFEAPRAVFAPVFKDRQTAGHFLRDFRVRSRLMDVSLKTVRGRAAAHDLRKDLESGSGALRLSRLE